MNKQPLEVSRRTQEEQEQEKAVMKKFHLLELVLIRVTGFLLLSMICYRLVAAHF